MKLSKTQIEVLRELSKEGNFLHHIRGLNPRWFFDWSMGNVRDSTGRVLRKHGLISLYSTGGFDNLRAKITDKGRKFIEDSK